MALLRQHTDPEACWVLLNGRVLDVTAYLGHHPGGKGIITKWAGRDCTAAFSATPHSQAALYKAMDYDVGAITDLKRLRRAAEKAAVHREHMRSLAKYL